jgi:hypothetical protein
MNNKTDISIPNEQLRQHCPPNLLQKRYVFWWAVGSAPSNQHFFDGILNTTQGYLHVSLQMGSDHRQCLICGFHDILSTPNDEIIHHNITFFINPSSQNR